VCCALVAYDARAAAAAVVKKPSESLKFRICLRGRIDARARLGGAVRRSSRGLGVVDESSIHGPEAVPLGRAPTGRRPGLRRRARGRASASAVSGPGVRRRL